MYNISREVLVLSQNYGLVGFKQNDGYIFYGNLKLNHQYNGIILKNDLYISIKKLRTNFIKMQMMYYV